MKWIIKLILNKLTAIAVSVVGLLLACSWVVVSISLPVNQMLWERLQPDSYQMRVTEQGPKGIWQWRVYIRLGQTKSVTLLEENRMVGCGPNYNQECDHITDLDDLTIEKIFELAEDCTEFYADDCKIDFDSRFRYPRRFGHLLTYVVTIDQFISCNQQNNCQSE